MTNTLTNDHEIRQQLLKRYRIRLSMVYKYPSPYYGKALWEKTEIEQKIKELNKINGTDSNRV